MSIIVGVDGSEQAQRALEWAVDEAALRGLAVAAVYVYLIPYSDPYGYWVDRVHLDESDKKAEELVSDAVEALGDRAAEVEITTEVVRGDTPQRALVDRSSDAELVVVGSRGRGGLAGMLLGSVSQQVAQHADCPVVIVRPPQT